MRIGGMLLVIAFTLLICACGGGGPKRTPAPTGVPGTPAYLKASTDRARP